MIVELADAKDALRIDDTADDAWLGLAIPAVEAAVAAWVGDPDRLYDHDESGAQTTPVPIVPLAIKVELAYQYRFREGIDKENDAYTGGHVLNSGTTALLIPLRKPVLA